MFNKTVSKDLDLPTTVLIIHISSITPSHFYLLYWRHHDPTPDNYSDLHVYPRKERQLYLVYIFHHNIACHISNWIFKCLRLHIRLLNSDFIQDSHSKRTTASKEALTVHLMEDVFQRAFFEILLIFRMLELVTDRFKNKM